MSLSAAAAEPVLAPDRCPGVLRLVEAADGLLARVRLTGGYVTHDDLDTLAEAADDCGDGRLELTSRGNVQLRGMTAAGAAELAQRLHGRGFLPTPSRDLVRNVLASPLAGIDTDFELAPFVRSLDDALQHEPGLDALSGRFLFGFDDGRGDIAALRPDVLRVVRPGDTPADLAEAMVAAAREFLATAGGAWRRPEAARTYDLAHPARPRPGRLARHDGGEAVVLAPPLGRLTSAQARWLAKHAADVRITPWRSIVVPHAPVADPAAAGFVTEPGSPWQLVSACAGRPRCAKALADVQADAAARLGVQPGRRLHWAGCERMCGRTPDVEVTMVATGDGYRTEESA